MLVFKNVPELKNARLNPELKLLKSSWGSQAIKQINVIQVVNVAREVPISDPVIQSSDQQCLRAARVRCQWRQVVAKPPGSSILTGTQESF